MKQIFNTPCEATKNRFKNKSKKLLCAEITEMISLKQDKLNKNDLINLWLILKNR